MIKRLEYDENSSKFYSSFERMMKRRDVQMIQKNLIR